MINTKIYRKNMVDIIAELKKLVDIYKEGEDKKESISKLSSAYTDEYLNSKMQAETSLIYGKADGPVKRIDVVMNSLAADLLKGEEDLELDNVEFVTALNILSSSKGVDNGLLRNIAEKFKGHNNVLKALAGTVEEPNRVYFNDRVVDYIKEVETLKGDIVEVCLDFPKNVLLINGVRDKFVKLADAVGEPLTEDEKDLGTGYNDLVNVQMRNAMGLQ